MSATNLPSCDCLNWCGDDPWLRDGRAAPCQERIDKERREREQADERKRIIDLANRLNDSAEKTGIVVVDAKTIGDLRDALVRHIKP